MRYGQKRFPIEDIAYKWSGQVMEPMDSLAFIGHNPGDTNHNNIYIATGDSGNGMTHGTIAGILLTDLILEKNNKWSTLYDPSREVKEDITKGSSSGEDDDSDSKGSSNKKIITGKIKIRYP